MCKQNVGVKTTSGICSMLVVWTVSDLVLQHPNSFTDNFEQIYYQIFFSLRSLFPSITFIYKTRQSDNENCSVNRI